MEKKKHVDDQLEMRKSDIRRLMRTRGGVVMSTLTQLARALKVRNKYVAGSSVLIVGCESSGSMRSPDCMAFKAALEKKGGSVYTLDHDAITSSKNYLSALKRLAPMVDALVIDTDTRYFRWLRPKDAKQIGLDIIIPTSLHA